MVLLFFNAYDVLYNYLYGYLCGLDEIGDYFLSDDIVVNTIHGPKFLFSDNFIYNNIFDFFDELLMDNNDYIFKLRASNENTKISQFSNLLAETLSDKKFEILLNSYDASVNFCVSRIKNNQYFFEIEISKRISFEVLSTYSPFYNATIFMDDGGEIFFIVLHSENIFYLYTSFAVYPAMNEKENDIQWVEDEKNNLCEKYNLSKRNLIKAFESYICKIKQEYN